MKHNAKRPAKFRFSKQDKEDWDRLTSSVKRKKTANDANDIFAESQEVPTENPARMPYGTNESLAEKLPPPAPVPKSLPSLRVNEANGIDAAAFRRLKRGKMPIDATLDLHAYTRDKAEAQLMRLIPNCRKQGKRCLRVITGKGTGVLQAALPQILNNANVRPHVLCFTHAIASHGGGGAFYVYLKKAQKNLADPL